MTREDMSLLARSRAVKEIWADETATVAATQNCTQERLQNESRSTGAKPP
jgi:hypothetical protein